MITIRPARKSSQIVKAPAGWGSSCRSLWKYLLQTEVHTYAFSVAANTILSLFPFIVMTWTIERRLFHSPAMESVLAEMIRYYLPAHQDFVLRNMGLLAHAQGKVQVISVVSLLISSTGVFLPLEVALNRVWGIAENRSYWKNQLLSLGLAFAVGFLALASIAFTTFQNRVWTAFFISKWHSLPTDLLTHIFLRFSAALFSVAIFFLIYWVLPNRKLPIRAVLPTAIVTGLLWDLAKSLYVRVLPHMDLESAYGPFSVSVGLMIWAFLTGLILLAGAHLSATRYTLRLAYLADLEEQRRLKEEQRKPQGEQREVKP